MKSTQKPLIHVTIDGEPKPVRFGFAALMDFCEAAGLTLADLQGLDLTTLGLKDLCRLYWAGFKDGARKEGQPFTVAGRPVDVYDVADYMDAISDEDQAAILGLFAAAQGADDVKGAEGKGVPQGQPQGKAKKAA